MKTIIEELAALPLIVRGSHDDVFKAVRALQERAQKTQTEPCGSAKLAAEELERENWLLSDVTPEEREKIVAIISKHFAATPD